jgi:hypothetical protein
MNERALFVLKWHVFLATHSILHCRIDQAALIKHQTKLVVEKASTGSNQ